MSEWADSSDNTQCFIRDTDNRYLINAGGTGTTIVILIQHHSKEIILYHFGVVFSQKRGKHGQVVDEIIFQTLWWLGSITTKTNKRDLNKRASWTWTWSFTIYVTGLGKCLRVSLQNNFTFYFTPAFREFIVSTTTSLQNASVHFIFPLYFILIIFCSHCSTHWYGSSVTVVNFNFSKDKF